MLIKAFPFKIQTIQTDNGTEFTYKYISENRECPFDTELRRLGIEHMLIPPRTPWHNGFVSNAHQMRYHTKKFFDGKWVISIYNAKDKIQFFPHTP